MITANQDNGVHRLIDLALADLTAGGGILKPAQAQKFMRLLIKDSVLLKLATVVPMGSPKQQISMMKFGSRILRPAQEGTALGATDRVKPDLSSVELDAKLFKAEVRLSDETLEDSIERGELRQTIMEMMAGAIARDMEEVAINGDVASTDPFLGTLDGLIKQATSNVVDAAGAPLSKELLRDLIKTLPSEHLRDKKLMTFLTSVDADLGYRNTLAERGTVAGDRFLEEDAPVLYSGVPLQPVPLFPENLGASHDFYEERGWYRVEKAIAEYLRSVREQSADPHAPLAFDVCTKDEAHAQEAKDHEAASARKAATDEIKLSIARPVDAVIAADVLEPAKDDKRLRRDRG